MIVHVCGVRGSCPAPGAAFVAVGGDTSCLALQHDDEDVPRLVLDAGTGLRQVTQLCGDRPFGGTILFGHLHWDHTQGLPFFAAADRPGARTILAVPEQGTDPATLFDRFLAPPAFPVRLQDLAGAWSTTAIVEGRQRLEGFDVLAREIPHKGGRTFGYRISDGRSSLAYLSDHGPLAALGAGPHGWGPYHDAALELCAGVDLLVHDAQHRAEELGQRAHLGHSAAEYAVELGRRGGAASVLLFHHDPGRADDEIDAMEAALRPRDGYPVRAARQGERLVLGG